MLDGRRVLAHIRASKSPKPGTRILIDGGGDALLLARHDALFELEFSEDVLPLLDRVGHMPLPPYIDRPDEDADRERYQTVYAQRAGAVAAPTAGLPRIRSSTDCFASASRRTTSWRQTGRWASGSKAQRGRSRLSCCSTNIHATASGGRPRCTPPTPLRVPPRALCRRPWSSYRAAGAPRLPQREELAYLSARMRTVEVNVIGVLNGIHLSFGLLKATPGAHVIDRFADRQPAFYGPIVEG